MNPQGIFFAILSPALYASINYVDKFLLQKYQIDAKVVTVYSGTFAFLASIIIFLFVGIHATSFKTILVILASGFFTQMYLLPYYEALSIDDPSRVIPLSQIAPVFALILSSILLEEQLTFNQYIGSSIITFACFLLAVEKFEAGIFKLRKAFWYMMLTALCVAMSYVLFKFGIEDIGFWAALPYEGLGIALGTLLILAFPSNRSRVLKRTKKLPKNIFLLLSINEVIFLLSRYTAFFASSLIPIGIVSVLYGFQPLFLLIFGSILSIWVPHTINEVISKESFVKKSVASLLIVVGLYFIFV